MSPYRLRSQLEEIAKLEEEHGLCGVRFSLKDPKTRYTTADIVDQAKRVIDHVIDLSSRLDKIPRRGIL